MDFKDRVDKETLVKIIKTIPSNIFLKDTEQRYVFSSHYWEQIDLGEDGDIYGKTDREIKIATLRKYLPEEYIEEIEE